MALTIVNTTTENIAFPRGAYGIPRTPRMKRNVEKSSSRSQGKRTNLRTRDSIGGGILF
jgi:hypothetical protein